MLRFAKPDSTIFPKRTEIKNRRAEPWSFNRFFSPFVIKHQKEVREVFNKAILTIFTFFSSLFVVFIILRRVRGRWTSKSTVAKSETTKACVTIPLMHWVLHLKSSHPLLKGLNLGPLFTFRGNGRSSPAMLCFHIGGPSGFHIENLGVIYCLKMF
jgi:hypothetical protein